MGNEPHFERFYVYVYSIYDPVRIRVFLILIMPIYSTPVHDVSSRLAAKKKQSSRTVSLPPTNGTNGTHGTKGKKKAASNPPEVAPRVETAQDRRNRMARERRAKEKQAKLDAAQGVTLATGKVQPPVRDVRDPVYKPPKDKDVIKGKRMSPTPDPPVPSPEPTPDPHPEPAPDPEPEPEPEPDSDETLVKKKQRKRRRVAWPAMEDPTEPPKWYTSLLTDVIKTKINYDGEKASKKIVKETSEEVAKEKWADPAERERQDKLFNQIFNSMY